MEEKNKQKDMENEELKAKLKEAEEKEGKEPKRRRARRRPAPAEPPCMQSPVSELPFMQEHLPQPGVGHMQHNDQVDLASSVDFNSADFNTDDWLNLWNSTEDGGPDLEGRTTPEGGSHLMSEGGSPPSCMQH